MEPSTAAPTEPDEGERSIGAGDSEGGVIYQSRQNLLTPADVRRQRFPMTRFGRRGLAPEAVGRFLRRVEIDLAALYQEVVAARDEARYYRDTLREMQAERWRPRESWARRGHGEYRRPPMWPPYSSRHQDSPRHAGDG